MVSRRSSDLSLYCLEGALDLAALAQVLHLRDCAQATIVTESVCTADMKFVRKIDR